MDRFLAGLFALAGLRVRSWGLASLEPSHPAAL